MSQLTGSQLRQKYLDFFKARGHVEIPPAPLVPENDPTTLFTSSGMQPLVPYLLGQPHPSGTRLVDSQPAIRAHGFNDDINDVGDNRHLVFFEMLGNWSLGDYFKKEQLSWFFEFLTQEVGLNPKKLYVSVFAGDPINNVPRDDESVEIWKQIFAKSGIDAIDIELLNEEKAADLGMQGGRIFYYDVKKNWWSRSGIPANMPSGEPGGPDSEVFYEFTHIEHDPKFGKHCHPNCDCGRFMEIGNSVFMQYLKRDDGSFEPLPKQNVDFGGGFERILAASYDTPDVFQTDLFQPIIKVLEKVSGKTYTDQKGSMRIIADHLKAAVFLISQGIEPSNKQQGYVVRRLLRRAAVKLRQLTQGNISLDIFEKVVRQIFQIYKGIYLDETKDLDRVLTIGKQELSKFEKTLAKGLSKIDKEKIENIDAAFAFDLFQSYGFPFEITQELVHQRGGTLDKESFDKEFTKHQSLSRTASAGMFKGGLADHSENTTKYHTATHLLHKALRTVLGDHVQQKGSNITGERLRFDFSHSEKLTETELKQIENIVNQQIKADLSVSFTTTSYDEAIKSGALAFFGERYPEQVKVYTIGNPAEDWFSREICGGPHVEHTGQIGGIKIFKQESLGSGTRRIYASLT